MSSTTDGSSGGPGGTRQRPRSPILDLKADQVSVEPAPASDSADAARAADAPAPAPEAAADSSAEPQPTASAAATEAAGPAPASEPKPPAAAAPPDATPEVETPAPSASGAPEPPAEPVRAPQDGPSRERAPSRRRGGWLVAGLALGAGAGAAAGAAALFAVASYYGLPLGGENRGAETAARLSALEQRLGEVAARPQPRSEPHPEVTARLAALEQGLNQFAGLERRLAQAEAALARAQNAPAPQPDPRIAAADAAVKSLGAELATLRQRLDAVAAAAQAAREAATRSSGASNAAAASAAGEIEALTKRISALEAATQALQSALAGATAPDRDRAARRAAAALALRAAVESGAPFAAEFAAVKAVAGDHAAVAALAPFASTGLPSAAALLRELAPLLAAARDSGGADENMGFFERLQAGAARLVRIRRTDEPPSAGEPGAPLAAVRTSAARGDLAGAMADIGKLPEAQRAPFEPWRQKAQARTSALAALHGFVRESLAALAAPGAEPARQ